MHLGKGLLVAVLLLCALSAAAADGAPVPDAPSFTRLRDTPSVVPVNYVPGFNMAEWAMPSPAAVLIAAVPEKKKVVDTKFLLLMAAGTGLTIADYEMTQHCMARRMCEEADPLLPHSRAGMYATNIPLNAALYYWSYRRKAQGKRLWWLPALAVAASHAVGVATNLKIQ